MVSGEKTGFHPIISKEIGPICQLPLTELVIGWWGRSISGCHVQAWHRLPNAAARLGIGKRGNTGFHPIISKEIGLTCPLPGRGPVAGWWGKAYPVVT